MKKSHVWVVFPLGCVIFSVPIFGATWMSQEVSKWLVYKWIITYYILTNGVYWGYNPLTNLLTSWHIQVCPLCFQKDPKSTLLNPSHGDTKDLCPCIAQGLAKIFGAPQDDKENAGRLGDKKSSRNMELPENSIFCTIQKP